jgi:flagellum-specific ATP synthase
MSFKSLQDKINNSNISSKFATVIYVSPGLIKAKGLVVSIGDIVRIVCEDEIKKGMVTGIDGNVFLITPFKHLDGLAIGDKVYIDNKGLKIGVGDGLLGRVVNALAHPIDGKGDIAYSSYSPIMKSPIPALNREVISTKLHTGVKTIDALLTCGKGQKLGIFAGSGVGKSTLMGMINKGTNAEVKIIALIGERGREVPEFIEHNLNGDLTNCVLIVVTSDDSALMRKYGAFCAMSIAEYFKDEGKDVLLIMDSITRFAMAQREIGLSLGEPPTSKGYPPSVMALLPQLMERAGNEKGKGSISAFFTILVDGDDLNDPIADQCRSILDGHIILDRDIVDSGIYPPINILKSASRVITNINDEKHQKLMIKFRKMYALLKENETIIRIGAYQKGNDPEIDEAIDKKKILNDFLSQDLNDIVPSNESLIQLENIFN